MIKEDVVRLRTIAKKYNSVLKIFVDNEAIYYDVTNESCHTIWDDGNSCLYVIKLPEGGMLSTLTKGGPGTVDCVLIPYEMIQRIVFQPKYTELTALLKELGDSDETITEVKNNFDKIMRYGYLNDSQK